MSVVVPGPLRAIRKLLFHEAALNNLEKPPLFFLSPLSELVTQVQLQTKPPLTRLASGRSPSPLGMSIPAVLGAWLLSARTKLTAWCLVQLSGSKLPFFLLKAMLGPCCLPETGTERSDNCLRGEKSQ